ncbi:thiopurine S-methyltransferase [Thalassotalea agarivorans]|uniref:Thiopurine S-methyltransferase n=1 Tax=Thalassotalea agarivorans TaxID=349064 RepID=A0A1I0DGG2_THASX|nr:thiopurine S-methyltransferase [Thalassotalea agarivorans]SET31450.1 thiopurine S-methyltransferase [Thalassotalea agarivorans]
MDAQFWHDVWHRDSLGFHQDTVHPLLSQQLTKYLPDANSHILVPLCGKSLDMLFLAQRHQVTGIELSDIACRDFFKENKLAYSTDNHGPFKRYSSEKIVLLQGDFFEAGRQWLSGDFPQYNYVYDRAALIALPKHMQQDYVDKLIQLLQPGDQILLITLEYPDNELQGPPFSVTEERVSELFLNHKVLKISQTSLPDGVFARRRFNVSYLKETAYLITVNA